MIRNGYLKTSPELTFLNVIFTTVWQVTEKPYSDSSWASQLHYLRIGLSMWRFSISSHLNTPIYLIFYIFLILVFIFLRWAPVQPNKLIGLKGLFIQRDQLNKLTRSCKLKKYSNLVPKKSKVGLQPLLRVKQKFHLKNREKLVKYHFVVETL